MVIALGTAPGGQMAANLALALATPEGPEERLYVSQIECLGELAFQGEEESPAAAPDPGGGTG